ncbi:MAG TPA: hypothetical protein DEP87_01685 [Candidatus Pacebacteria bacterium]|nr:hypothetical protein [Candidatus Paceibacterota bacterium]
MINGFGEMSEGGGEKEAAVLAAEVGAVAEVKAAASSQKVETLAPEEREALLKQAQQKLQQIIDAAAVVIKAPDAFARLGFDAPTITPQGGEDLVYHQKLNQFRPERSTQTKAEILGNLAEFFPELNQLAVEAEAACNEATQQLQQDWEVLSHPEKRQALIAQLQPERSLKTEVTSYARQLAARIKGILTGAGNNYERNRREQPLSA